MTYTAEEVRDEAEAVGMVAQCRKDREPEWSRTAEILNAYAALLERQAAGVTDEVVRRFVAAYMAAVGPGPILNFDAIKSALLAAQAVAAEPAAQQAARVDDGMVETAYKVLLSPYNDHLPFLGLLRAALEAALSAQPAERQGEADVTDADLEAMRAAALEIQHNKESWFPMTDRRMRRSAKALLALHPAAHVGVPAQSRSVPDGWVLVPREPTDAMVDKAWGAQHPKSVWELMLAAAQPAPQEPQS